MTEEERLQKRLQTVYRAIDRQLCAYSLAEREVDEAVLYALYREVFALEDGLTAVCGAKGE